MRHRIIAVFLVIAALLIASLISITRPDLALLVGTAAISQTM